MQKEWLMLVWKLNLQDGSSVVTENALKMFEDVNKYGVIITQFEETEKLKHC